MKHGWRMFGAVALLLVGTCPVWAEVELRADLGVGQLGTEWVSDQQHTVAHDTDLEGWMLGLGVAGQDLRMDFDYIHTDLDEAVAGDDVNTLRDLRIGYRFYEADGFGLMALGSYIDDRCGAFKAKGPALGLGFENAFNRKWSIHGRIGYSPWGVKVKNGSAEVEDAAMLPAALGVKYQWADQWSFQTEYRYYGFLGEDQNKDVTSKVDLVTAGVTYRFGAGTKAKPESKVPPSPEADPKKERQEKINQFLQPVFFDLDCDQIRSDQIPVLEKNLRPLKANPDLNIIVAGHADQPGSPAYNQGLSQRRAERIKAWLVDQGIREKRIYVYAYGKENPYRDKAQDHAWESDRWVDIFVTDEKPTRETGLRK